MRIYHNIPALNAYNQLNMTQNALAGSIKKLASGLRINGAADDAAGLAISEKMRAQIKGLDVATRNAQDGISMIQTAEGALESTNSILQRMRELAVQAANDTLTQQDREYIQLEINQLRDEVDRIANSTQFNKKKLLNGSASVLWSSDSLNTKLFVKGGLRQVDQFGQKNVAEGNYKVIVNANPGQAEVQKSDIFKIKHANVISDLSFDNKRITGVKVDNLPAGDYTVKDAMVPRLSDGTLLASGTWVAAGASYLSGITFAAGSIFSAGAVFQSGTIGVGAVLRAGTVTAGNFIAGSRFSAGSTFAANSTFVSGTVFDIGSEFAVGTVFKYADAGVGATVSATGRLAAGSLIEVRDNVNLFGENDSFRVMMDDGVPQTFSINQLWLGALGNSELYQALLYWNNNSGSATQIVLNPGTTAELMNDSTLANAYNFSVTVTSRSEVSFTTNDASSDVVYTASTQVRVGAGGATLDQTGTVGSGGATVDTIAYVSGSATVGATGDARFAGANTVTLGATYTSPTELTIGQTYSSNSRAMQLGTGGWTPVNGLDAIGEPVRYFPSPTQPQEAKIYQTFGLTPFGANYGLSLTGALLADFSGTANILLEVKNVDLVSKIVTFKAIAQVTFANGETQSFVVDDLQVREGATDGQGWTAFGVTGQLFTLATNAVTGAGYTVGDKITLGMISRNAADSVDITVTATQNRDWEGYWGTALQKMTFTLNEGDVGGKDVHFRSFYLNTANGTVYESDIAISFGTNYSAHTSVADLTTFKATYVGQTALLDTQLRDIDKFWDANGKFMLDDPKTLTITQGDGKSTTVTIYSNDTMGDFVRKFNEAVAKGLKQGDYVSDASKFSTFVQSNTLNTSETVQGTIVIRTAINGMGGALNISGDEDVMNALSLNTIQTAKENEFYVSIQDAHTGETVASSVKVAGNYAVGILHPNLDFEFDASADMTVVWNDKNKKYETIANDGSEYTTIIHVADNTSVFQIGANEGEDMAIDIGDMGTRSLGLHKVLLTNRTSAARSITIIDSALNTLSTQRSKLGAYQNRLEYTVNSLTTAAENLTASEARIRDLDMAKEMMNFTKLNILMQAGQSMLSQANQMPQSILQLLRG